ncbi:MAG: T9SS type A sorting domain-containing protein [bacterium]
MKHFYYRILSVSMLIIFSLSVFMNTYAQEMQRQKYCYPESNYLKSNTLGEYMLKPYVDKNPKTQSVMFQTIDSTAHMYNYLFMLQNKPFILEKETGYAITIHRGYHHQQNTNNVGYDGDDWHYNLFINISKDGGASWDIRKCVYDKVKFGTTEARYPNVKTINLDGIQQYAVVAPLIDYNYAEPKYSVNKGHISVFWNEDVEDLTTMEGMLNEEFTYNGKTYHWDYGSRILVDHYIDNPNNYFLLVASTVGLMQGSTSDWANASHIGIRRTEDLNGGFVEEIPPQWASNKFKVVTENDTRYNQIIDFQMTSNQDMYLAVYGGFIDDPINNMGVSKSTDYGATWSEFDRIPMSLYNDYRLSLGYNDNHAVYTNGYESKGFKVFDNGDWSIVLKATIGDSTDPNNVISVEHLIMEIYKEDSEWGIRRVDTCSGWNFGYEDQRDANNRWSNPAGEEVQLGVSFDGSKLLAKWVDLINPTQQGFETSDVFISTRTKNSQVWSKSENITQSEEIDKSTLIPNDIPNDLINIPLLKQSLINSQGFPRDSEFVSSRYPQYIKVGHFNAVVSVDENQFDNSKLTLEVLPNPVNDFARIQVYYEGKPVYSEIAVFDVLGNKVTSFELGVLGYGTSYRDFKTAGLSSGIYFCTVTVGDRKVTKMLNVIK